MVEPYWEMSFQKVNPNPIWSSVDDCAIRAIAIALDKTWDDVYIDLCVQGYLLKNIPSSKMVVSEYLLKKGFERTAIQNTCPACYTVADFAHDHPIGTYILVTASHAVAIVSGDYLDAWDSGDEVPMYYWRKHDK
ncbi:MAG: hypothetical protein IJM83_08485 [Firmicutes bacterium]|nr:hypothetical protein [Bacillota bacterium]